MESCLKCVLMLMLVATNTQKIGGEETSRIFFDTANRAASKKWNNYIKAFCFKFLERSLLVSQKSGSCIPTSTYLTSLECSMFLSSVWKTKSFLKQESFFSSTRKKVYQYLCTIKSTLNPRQLCLRNGNFYSWYNFTENENFTAPKVSYFGFNPFICYVKCDKSDMTKTYTTQEHIVPRASGYFQVRYPDSNAQLFSGASLYPNIFQVYWVYMQHIAWHFILDSRLSLNLTFITLLFSRRPKFLFCQQGSLNVYESHPVPSQRQFMFCEHHAVFSVFPGFQEITVNLTTTVLTVVRVEFLFGVLDRGVVKTVHEKYTATHAPIAEPYSAVVSLLKTSLLTFLLKVNKLQVIHLVRLWESVVIFDGPDLSSPKIANSPKMKTSTFQCVVQIQSFHLDLKMVNYTVKPRNLRNVVIVSEGDKKHISLPSSDCSGSVCVILLKASMPLNINVSVVHFSSEGETSHACVFGGLQKIDLNMSSHMDDIPLCDRSAHSQGNVGRSLYSHTSSMAIVLYWYKHKCTINTTLFAGLTPCKHVRIVECAGYPIDFGFVEKQFGISLKNTKDGELNLDGLTVTVPANSCSVLQILPHHTDESRWKCTSHRLIGEEKTEPGFQITYSVKSYFGKMPKLHEYFCLKTGCQSLEIEGKFTQFCVQSSKRFLCQNRTKAKWTLLPAKENPETRLSFFLRTMTPTFSSYFTLMMSSHFSSDSWMDVEVFCTKLDTTSKVSLAKLQFSEMYFLNTSTVR